MSLVKNTSASGQCWRERLEREEEEERGREKRKKSAGELEGSPPFKRPCIDRFIPYKDAILPLRSHLDLSFNRSKLLQGSQRSSLSPKYVDVLHSELLGYSPTSAKVFTFRPREISSSPSRFSENVSLLNDDSQNIMVKKCSPRKLPRRPLESYSLYGLRDDFYLHLLAFLEDWSTTNLLAVGLQNRPQLINRTNGKIIELPAVPFQITCVHWLSQGDTLMVGTENGGVVLFDIPTQKITRYFRHDRGRVGVATSLTNLLTTGSRNSSIFHHDLRQNSDFPVREFVGHKQEVCGLQWSCDERYLASGGNDNNALIWSNTATSHRVKLKGHTAAVKGLAWSPHNNDMLATGGGTADRTIRIWNVKDFSCQSVTETGSQVCNLAWSKHADEIVSTHGFSMFQINLWNAPSMEIVGTLFRHRKRVLYLALSPDGDTLATASGDGALHLWGIYPKREMRPTEKYQQYATIR